MLVCFSDQILVQLPSLFRSDGSIGGIICNESMILRNATYVANATIFVVEGGSLKIGRNCTVLFAPGCGIIVKEYGQLTIEGPAVLASSTAGEVWDGIRLENSSETMITNGVIIDAFIGLRSRSMGALNIDHTTFEGIFSDAIKLESSSTSFLNLSSVFFDCPGGSGVSMEDSHSIGVIMVNVTIKRPGQSGFYASCYSLPPTVINMVEVYIDSPMEFGVWTSCSLNLKNSTIKNGPGSGLYLYQPLRIVLEDNNINMTESSYAAAQIYTPSITLIRGNTFTCSYQCLHIEGAEESLIAFNVFKGADYSSSSGYLVLIEGGVMQSSSFSLRNNSFCKWTTTSGAVHVSIEQHWGDGFLMLSGNHFYDITAGSNSDAVFVHIAQYNGREGTLSLSDNIFFNISAGAIFGLDFSNSDSPVNIANSFQSSLIASASNCQAAFCILNWPTSCGDGACSLVGNIFNYSLPQGQCHLVILESADFVPTIDASLSYWGTANELELKQTICDGKDDVKLSTILYLPYLLSASPEGERRSVKIKHVTS